MLFVDTFYSLKLIKDTCNCFTFFFLVFDYYVYFASLQKLLSLRAITVKNFFKLMKIQNLQNSYWKFGKLQTSNHKNLNYMLKVL